MEFIESFKLTDIERVEREGLDRKDLAKRVADTFLYQIVDTAYFHCDPHPGNLAVDTKGNLVYYDFGMMDELSPNVKAGFKEFCFAWSRRPAGSRHRRDSSPGEQVVGGLFFDFWGRSDRAEGPRCSRSRSAQVLRGSV